MSTNQNYLPAEYNTGIVRGDYFSESFAFSLDGDTLDLTDSFVRIYFRDAGKNIIAEYSTEPRLNPPPATHGITTTLNVVHWSIDETETAEFVPGIYDYDVEVTINGKIRTYIKGKFTVEKDITY